MAADRLRYNMLDWTHVDSSYSTAHEAERLESGHEMKVPRQPGEVR